jgi:hypothetical protein
MNAAKSAGKAGLNERRFDKASTHWICHTSVCQELVYGVPIEVVSELAGHASIDTKSIYSTQELARQVNSLQGMKGAWHGNSGPIARALYRTSQDSSATTIKRFGKCGRVNSQRSFPCLGHARASTR